MSAVLGLYSLNSTDLPFLKKVNGISKYMMLFSGLFALEVSIAFIAARIFATMNSIFTGAQYVIPESLVPSSPKFYLPVGASCIIGVVSLSLYLATESLITRIERG